jgi:hypothetical protein
MDKRKYVRAIFDCEILYPTVFTDNTKKTYIESSYCLCAVDISEAGICMQSNFKIPIESFISFYMRIGDNLPFKALVKIRWNKVMED